MDISSIFEAGMLLCFGASWPLSVLKTWKMKTGEGKSFGFMWLIFLGYVSGTLYKITGRTDLVIILYIYNGILVGTDLGLSYYFRNRLRKKISG
ncbi:MAG: hypothetical protein ACLFUS_17540 [Candidatus Sumerlaeia bacterium]